MILMRGEKERKSFIKDEIWIVRQGLPTVDLDGKKETMKEFLFTFKGGREYEISNDNSEYILLQSSEGWPEEFLDIFGKRPNKHATQTEEVKPESKSGDVNNLFLKDENIQETVVSIARRVAEDPNFASLLSVEFAKAGARLPDVDIPAPELPETAPRLWRDRLEGRKINPAQFIRDVYAPWIDQGLTRDHINKVDPALYVAYAQWIRPERHPEDAIKFTAGSGRGKFIADPVEAIERRRAADRASKIRTRANADNLSHSPT